MLFQVIKSFAPSRWQFPAHLGEWWFRRSNAWLLCIVGLCVVLLGCSVPQVSAESRLFLNLSMSPLGQYDLAQMDFEGSTVGGFSALSYDRQQDRIYALVDDDTQPRFYTLSLQRQADNGAPKVAVESVTRLQDASPQNSSSETISSRNVSLEKTSFENKNLGNVALDPSGQASTQSPTGVFTLDGEGIEVTRHRVFVASEGNPTDHIPPRLSEFQLESGDWQTDLPLPKQYWQFGDDGTMTLGVQPNKGLESLAINEEGDRLFAATEIPLMQDMPTPGSTPTYYSRFLHYWIGEPEPLLISEHLYPLDPPSPETTLYGLSDLVPVDNGGHFLTLERAYSPAKGYSAKIYQIVTGNATDTSRKRTLTPGSESVQPILKKLLLNLDDLNIPLQNLEGMILGPILQDGSRSVILASDNGFQSDTPTQFLWLRLEQHPQSEMRNTAARTL